MSEFLEELQKLADLRDRGILTPEEFEAEKAALLKADAAGAGPATANASAVTTVRETVIESAGTARPSPARSRMLPAVVAGLVVFVVALFALGVLGMLGGGSLLVALVLAALAGGLVAFSGRRPAAG